jgi:hypothetical protein
MTRRSRRLIKIAVVVYAAGLGAFIYAASKGRSRITRPELIPERLTIVQRGMFTGWRAEDRFEQAKREIVASRYRMHGEQADLEAGQLIDRSALEKLIVANPGTVLVLNPRLCIDLARTEPIAGEELSAPDGTVIARVGDVLDEERLVRLAITFDAEEGEARHERVWIRGTGRFVFLDVTAAFVGVSFLVLAALMYALLWEPMQRVLDERIKAIRDEVETAKREREAGTSPPAEDRGNNDAL